jgi:hypothetical protein
MTYADKTRCLRGLCARCSRPALPDRSQCASCLESSRRCSERRNRAHRRTDARPYRCRACGGPRHNVTSCPVASPATRVEARRR